MHSGSVTQKGTTGQPIPPEDSGVGYLAPVGPSFSCSSGAELQPIFHLQEGTVSLLF